MGLLWSYWPKGCHMDGEMQAKVTLCGSHAHLGPTWSAGAWDGGHGAQACPSSSVSCHLLYFCWGCLDSPESRASPVGLPPREGFQPLRATPALCTGEASPVKVTSCLHLPLKLWFPLVPSLPPSLVEPRAVDDGPWRPWTKKLC